MSFKVASAAQTQISVWLPRNEILRAFRSQFLCVCVHVSFSNGNCVAKRMSSAQEIWIDRHVTFSNSFGDFFFCCVTLNDSFKWVRMRCANDIVTQKMWTLSTIRDWLILLTAWCIVRILSVECKMIMYPKVNLTERWWTFQSEDSCWKFELNGINV